MKNIKLKLIRNTIVSSTLLCSGLASATVVEFETNQGNFKVNLYDNTTPKTVENFLAYINDGAYANNIIHRKVSNFVVQGGGYSYDGELPLTAIATFPTIINEPVWSNVKGTIAMAKRSGDHNSATSQWYVNLKDNSTSLDGNEGGYTVFGQIIEDGMDVFDKINALNTCPGQEVPMIDFDDAQCAAGEPGAENFVTVYSVTIADATVDTTAGLTMVKNNRLSSPDNNSSSGGGGGTFAFTTLLLAGLVRLFRK